MTRDESDRELADTIQAERIRNRRPAKAMSEADLQDAVMSTAETLGWLSCHFRPARTHKGWATPIQGDRGFPDTVLVRRGRVIFVELKAEKGRVTEEQQAWLDGLKRAGIREVYVWRPADWLAGRIIDCLREDED